MSDYYSKYIASEQWRQKREQALQRDSHQCQTCLSTEDLEVHHKTYANLGNEPLEDLISLCHSCHEAITSSIRERRYAIRQIEIEDHQRTTKPVEYKQHGTSEIEISDHGRITPTSPQREDLRSFGQIHQSIEDCKRKTE